jgi:hypothetical protein
MEQDDMEITLFIIMEIFCSNLDQIPAIVIKDFLGFSQSLQANTWIICRLGHNSFLPNPL